jgi:hypothetical protein
MEIKHRIFLLLAGPQVLTLTLKSATADAYRKFKKVVFFE